MKIISLNTVLAIFVLLRIATIFISAANERKLKKMGAIEYGGFNSALLILMHFIFYLACVAEGQFNDTFYYNNIGLNDQLSTIGLGIYIFSIVILYYIIFQIRHIWTVKLIIAPKYYHVINKSFIFRVFKHPNYFLNVLPELFGLGLVFHATFTILIVLPLNFFLLIIRINKESEVMKQHFTDY